MTKIFHYMSLNNLNLYTFPSYSLMFPLCFNASLQLKTEMLTFIGLCEDASSMVLSKWSLSSFVVYLGNSSSESQHRWSCRDNVTQWQCAWQKWKISKHHLTCLILMVFMTRFQVAIVVWHLYFEKESWWKDNNDKNQFTVKCGISAKTVRPNKH